MAENEALTRSKRVARRREWGDRKPRRLKVEWAKVWLRAGGPLLRAIQHNVMQCNQITWSQLKGVGSLSPKPARRATAR